jgi:hypothetical protein
VISNIFNDGISGADSNSCLTIGGQIGRILEGSNQTVCMAFFVHCGNVKRSYGFFFSMTLGKSLDLKVIISSSEIRKQYPGSFSLFYNEFLVLFVEVKIGSCPSIHALNKCVLSPSSWQIFYCEQHSRASDFLLK